MPVMNRREYIIGGTLMIGGVAGFAVKPSKPEGNAVNLKDALSSGFTEGRVVTLLLAYNRAQSYASQLHRPDVCYPASGFKILRQKDVDIDISSLRQQRLEIFRAALSRKNLDGIVVRASTPTSATGDSGEVLTCFVQEFADSLSDAQAELLIGPVS